jgi:hypothetical protein
MIGKWMNVIGIDNSVIANPKDKTIRGCAVAGDGVVLICDQFVLSVK